MMDTLDGHISRQSPGQSVEVPFEMSDGHFNELIDGLIDGHFDGHNDEHPQIVDSPPDCPADSTSV
jgi:hypothetical protein